jgi:hypothetical protein
MKTLNFMASISVVYFEVLNIKLNGVNLWTFNNRFRSECKVIF